MNDYLAGGLKISVSEISFISDGMNVFFNKNGLVRCMTIIKEHFFVATSLLACNFIFPLKSLCKENILTNQMKMILSEVPNQIFGRYQTK